MMILVVNDVLVVRKRLKKSKNDFGKDNLLIETGMW